eukprot:Opistho-2@36810
MAQLARTKFDPITIKIEDRKTTVTPIAFSFDELNLKHKKDSVGKGSFLDGASDDSGAVCSLVPGIHDADFVHAAAALYDVGLPAVTLEVIYSMLSKPNATTIVLLRSEEDVLEERRQLRAKSSERRHSHSRPNTPKRTDGAQPIAAEDVAIEHPLEPAHPHQFTGGKPRHDHHMATDGRRTPDNRMSLDGAMGAGGHGGHDGQAAAQQHMLHPTSASNLASGSAADAVSLTDAELDSAAIFSDSEAEDEPEGEDPEVSELMTERTAYVREAYNRQKRSMTSSARGERRNSGAHADASQQVGIESRLLGALTLEQVLHAQPGTGRVMQITLLGVRPKFRRHGIGGRLIGMVKDPLVVGAYDAMITYADNGATFFFQKHHFKADTILNLRYVSLIERWDNSVLMSLVPGFAHTTPAMERLMDKAFDEDLLAWRRLRATEYTQELDLIERLRSEIKRLRSVVSEKDDEIGRLNRELVRARRPQSAASITGLSSESQQLANGSSGPATSRAGPAGVSASQNQSPQGTSVALHSVDSFHDSRVAASGSSSMHVMDCSDADRPLSTASSSLAKHVASSGGNGASSIGLKLFSGIPGITVLDSPLGSTNGGVLPKYIDAASPEYTEITSNFLGGMRETGKSFKVMEVTAPVVTKAMRASFDARVDALRDPNLQMRLWFGGHPDVVQRCAAAGSFAWISASRDGNDALATVAQLAFGDFGKGIYFSGSVVAATRRSEASAAGDRFAILALVGLGMTESILKPNSERSAAPDGFDSIAVPGRTRRPSHSASGQRPSSASSTSSASSLSLVSSPPDVEYVVFDGMQAMPLYCIRYREG